MVQAEAKTDRLASIDLDKLRSHWEGHRQLTRRVIDVFPEDKLLRIRWAECARSARWRTS